LIRQIKSPNIFYDDIEKSIGMGIIQWEFIGVTTPIGTITEITYDYLIFDDTVKLINNIDTADLLGFEYLYKEDI
jgi:hypothetical protein